jgi:hypothetical protein
MTRKFFAMIMAFAMLMMTGCHAVPKEENT